MFEAIQAARPICLLALAVACVYTDLAWHRIPNALTIPGLVVGLVTAYLLDAGLPGLPHLKSAAIAMLAGGGLLFLIYLVGGLGAGDVKLMAAVGALGPDWRFALTALAYTALVGAVIAIGSLIWKGRLLDGLRESARTLFTFRARRKEGQTPLTIPYGLAIGIGTIWAWMEMAIF